MNAYRSSCFFFVCIAGMALQAKVVQMPKEVPFSATGKPLAATVSTTAEELKSHRFSGQIMAPRDSELSFQQPGHIQFLQQPGAVVKKGEVVARLDEFDFQQGFSLAQSKKKMADIQAENAKREYEREVQLRASQASTDTVFDMKKSAYEQAKVGVNVAAVELQMAKERLNRAHLLAPYDCAIGKKQKNEFEYINTGMGVLTVYEIGRVEVHFHVPESFLGQIHVKDLMQVTVPAVGFQGEATVLRVVSVVEERTRTFEVVGQLTTPSPQVVPGLFAQAQLSAPTPK